jgi:hypothetical protein
MSEENTKEQDGARPIEERILARLDTIDARLQRIETNPVWTEALTFLNEMNREMQAGFRNLDRRIGVLSNDVNQLRADQSDVFSRLEKLEPQARR